MFKCTIKTFTTNPTCDLKLQLDMVFAMCCLLAFATPGNDLLYSEHSGIPVSPAIQNIIMVLDVAIVSNLHLSEFIHNRCIESR